jgi:hypothetical protein
MPSGNFDSSVLAGTLNGYQKDLSNGVLFASYSDSNTVTLLNLDSFSTSSALSTINGPGGITKDVGMLIDPVSHMLFLANPLSGSFQAWDTTSPNSPSQKTSQITRFPSLGVNYFPNNSSIKAQCLDLANRLVYWISSKVYFNNSSGNYVSYDYIIALDIVDRTFVALWENTREYSTAVYPTGPQVSDYGFVNCVADPYRKVLYVMCDGLNNHGILTYSVDTGIFQQTGTIVDSGTATSGSTLNTLEDTSKSWTTNVHVGRLCRLVSGTGVGQIRIITANTANTLTVGWQKFNVAIPTNTTQYEIYSTSFVNYFVDRKMFFIGSNSSSDCIHYIDTTNSSTTIGRMLVTTGAKSQLAINNVMETGQVDSATASTISDVKSWTLDQFKGNYVRISAGTGVGQVRKIAGNSSTGDITVEINFWIIPDGTSTYEVLQKFNVYEYDDQNNYIPVVLQNDIYLYDRATYPAGGSQLWHIYSSYEYMDSSWDYYHKKFLVCLNNTDHDNIVYDYSGSTANPVESYKTSTTGKIAFMNFIRQVAYVSEPTPIELHFFDYYSNMKIYIHVYERYNPPGGSVTAFMNYGGSFNFVNPGGQGHQIYCDIWVYDPDNNPLEDVQVVVTTTGGTTNRPTFTYWTNASGKARRTSAGGSEEQPSFTVISPGQVFVYVAATI